MEQSQVQGEQIHPIEQQPPAIGIVPFSRILPRKPYPTIVKTAIDARGHGQEPCGPPSETIPDVRTLAKGRLPVEPLEPIAPEVPVATDTGGLIKFKIIPEVKVALEAGGQDQAPVRGDSMVH